MSEEEHGCNDMITLQWRHNERDGVSNHQPYDCLFMRLFRRRSKKKSKLRVTVSSIPYWGITSYALDTSPQVSEASYRLSILSDSENIIVMYREHWVYMLH